MTPIEQPAGAQLPLHTRRSAPSRRARRRASSGTHRLTPSTRPTGRRPPQLNRRQTCPDDALGGVANACSKWQGDSRALSPRDRIAAANPRHGATLTSRRRRVDRVERTDGAPEGGDDGGVGGATGVVRGGPFCVERAATDSVSIGRVESDIAAEAVRAPTSPPKTQSRSRT
jgi:hypothetical protein